MFRLLLTTPAKLCDENVRNGEGPAAQGRLRSFKQNLGFPAFPLGPGEPIHRLLDRRPTSYKVHVLPTEPEEFSLSHPGHEGGEVQRVVP